MYVLTGSVSMIMRFGAIALYIYDLALRNGKEVAGAGGLCGRRVCMRVWRDEIFVSRYRVADMIQCRRGCTGGKKNKISGFYETIHGNNVLLVW